MELERPWCSISKGEEFDGLKPKIDWSIVESFPFPAPFEEQRYIGDEGEIHVYSWDGRKETTLVGPYSVRKLYLEHFGDKKEPPDKTGSSLNQGYDRPTVHCINLTSPLGKGPGLHFSILDGLHHPSVSPSMV